MIKTLLLIIASSFTALSCNGQSVSTDRWTTYEYPEMGVRADFPCKPLLNGKVFQEKPKLARSFSMSCSFNDYNFAISLPERFGEYAEEKANEELKQNEEMLRVLLEEKASFTARSLVFENCQAREFVIKNDWSVGRKIDFSHERGIYSLHVQRPDRTVTLTPSQLAEFEVIASKFINSFDLLR